MKPHLKHIKGYPGLSESWDSPYDAPDYPDPVRDAKELPKGEKLFHFLGADLDYALLYKGSNPKDLWLCDVQEDVIDFMRKEGYWHYYPMGEWEADEWTEYWDWDLNDECLEDFLTNLWNEKISSESRTDFFTTAGDGQNLSRYLYTFNEMPEPEEGEEEIDDLFEDRRCFQVDSQVFAEHLIDYMTRNMAQQSQRVAQNKKSPSYKTGDDRSPSQRTLETRRLILILSRAFPPR